MGLTKNYATTLYNWLSKFSTVYREPVLSANFTDAERPSEYITYSCEVGNFNTDFLQALTIYSKSTGYTKVMEIVDRIEDEVGENGIRVDDTWGFLTIYKGSPFCQDKPDEDDTIRSVYVNLIIRVCQI